MKKAWRGWRTLVAVTAVCGLLTLLGLSSSTAAPEGAKPSWDAFVAAFLESHFNAHPDEAVLAGRHDFDGRLPDWSPTGLAAELDRLRDLKRRALEYGDAALPPRQRIERQYLVAQVDKDLFWRETADWPHRNPYFYADPLDPDVYVSRDYAPLAERLRAYTRYARAVPRAVAEIRANLQLPLPRPWLRIGRRTLGGLSAFYANDVPTVFASIGDKTLLAEFRVANAGAIAAIEGLDAWLAAQEPQATDAFALGPEKFQAMLHATERVDVPLERLEAIGRADLERNLAALKSACAEFAPGQSVDDCVARADRRKPKGNPVEAARAQLRELCRFLVEKKLLSIPSPEEALVREAPAYKAWNFAYINTSGPYEKGLPSIYYIAPPDPTWPREKQEAYLPSESQLLFTSVHEVWPGHFLQFLHAHQAPSKFGQVFVGYAFAEGWAHYAEEMMWDAGLGQKDPETHIGQLREALLRNVRFVSAIGLHTKGMTVAESERLFREAGHQDAGNAEQQAERGTFDPAYLNYTLGKLMIRKLRDDWTSTRGGREAWGRFHDGFLSYGGPPIPIVREGMVGKDAGPPL